MGVKTFLGMNAGATFHNEKTGNREPKDESLRKELGLPPYSDRWKENDMSENYRNGWSHLGEGLGIAAVVLSICLGLALIAVGMGGCSYLDSKGSAARIQAEHVSNVSTNK